jgi:desulfoferrodoxin (superoxide reductase-like protein)
MNTNNSPHPQLNNHVIDWIEVDELSRAGARVLAQLLRLDPAGDRPCNQLTARGGET